MTSAVDSRAKRDSSPKPEQDEESVTDPPAAAPPPPAASQQAQPRRPALRNNFELEPNPFEQSFSRSSNSVVKTSDDDTPEAGQKYKSDNPSVNGSVGSATDSHKDSSSSSPKPTLPPLAALASPGTRNFTWGLSSAGLTNHNSLRSGPLSPAMLSGPTNVNHPTPVFDHNSFRTGLTPGTGLTPLVGGPTSFPPPSPNTAAFLAMVTGAANSSSLPSVGATITPNTLSALTGTLPNGGASLNGDAPAEASNQLPYDQQQSQASRYTYGDNSSSDTNAQTSAANAATTAANGLFLLSQAHQELTKREEAQARAGSKHQAEDNMGIVPSATNKRGAKRKQEESVQKGGGKKAKGGRKKKEETPTDSEEEPESPVYDANESVQRNGKEMTDEEKRKNFLERNRQAALKCRQRKKAWLSQLQAKVEFLSTENERLTTALVSSREEISRLNALVGAHPPPHMQQSNHIQGANGSHIGAGIGQNQQPISVAVSLPGGGKNSMVGGTTAHGGGAAPTGVTAGGGSGRGYGY